MMLNEENSVTKNMEASVQIMLILLHDFSVFYSNTLSLLVLLDYLNLINLNKFTFAFYKLQNTTKANNKNMNLANIIISQLL